MYVTILVDYVVPPRSGIALGRLKDIALCIFDETPLYLYVRSYFRFMTVYSTSSNRNNVAYKDS